MPTSATYQAEFGCRGLRAARNLAAFTSDHLAFPDAIRWPDEDDVAGLGGDKRKGENIMSFNGVLRPGHIQIRVTDLRGGGPALRRGGRP